MCYKYDHSRLNLSQKPDSSEVNNTFFFEMKPTDFYQLPVLLAVLMATLLITPSDGQIASVYQQHPVQLLRSNSTNPIIAYSNTADLVGKIKPVTPTTRTTEVTDVGPTEQPAKLESSAVSAEVTTGGQGIAEASLTVQAEGGTTEEDSSEEEDEEVVDENSATEEVDETIKE